MAAPDFSAAAGKDEMEKRRPVSIRPYPWNYLFPARLVFDTW